MKTTKELLESADMMTARYEQFVGSAKAFISSLNDARKEAGAIDRHIAKNGRLHGSQHFTPRERALSIEIRRLRRVMSEEMKKRGATYDQIARALQLSKEAARREHLAMLDEIKGERMRSEALANDPSKDILFQSVDNLELSIRSAHGLDVFGIKLIGELVQMTEEQVLRTRYLGRRSLREIKNLLSGMGLMLGTQIPNWQERLKAHAASS